MIVDLTFRRTYATGRVIDLKAKMCSVKGNITSNAVKDAVVVPPNDLVPPVLPDPPVIVAKANQLRTQAHDILQQLLTSLNLNSVVITPTPVTDPVLALLQLPDWSLVLADLAQMICGIDDQLIFKQEKPSDTTVKVFTVRPKIKKDGRACNSHLKKKFNDEVSLTITCHSSTSTTT